MGRLLDDLLAYTRVSSPRMTLSQVDCEKVLDGVLANLKATIEETRAVVSHDAMPTVLYNEAHLMQLLQNLIGNAVKYHGKEPPKIHVGANRIGEERVFSVKGGGVIGGEGRRGHQHQAQGGVGTIMASSSAPPPVCGLSFHLATLSAILLIAARRSRSFPVRPRSRCSRTERRRIHVQSVADG
ncbi:MAG: hypothetical protein ACE15C_16285 [Phycisphaerae bacterium]